VANDGRSGLLESGTAGSEPIQPPTLPSATRPALSELTEGAGFLRSRARALHEDVGSLHRDSVYQDWNNWTNRRARVGSQELLDELGDLGFAWRDVARLIGVSVAAVQKWRRGERTTGENRRRIASLLAACDMITRSYGIQEVASWMEMPVRADVPVTPTDLWVAERVDLVFDLASGHVDADDILADFDSEWRERYRSDFEVFKAGDGRLSIRGKEQ